MIIKRRLASSGPEPSLLCNTEKGFRHSGSKNLCGHNSALCPSFENSRNDEIISFAYEIMMIAAQLSTIPKEALKDKRSHIIERLRRSRELEEYALIYMQKALANLSD